MIQKSKVSRFIGSMDVDYKVHFLPDLKLHVTHWVLTMLRVMVPFMFLATQHRHSTRMSL